MSLLQLLTTGKALEGVHDSSHRYQMTNQRLLPKFGSKRNPFAATGTPTPSAEPAVAIIPAAPEAVKPAPPNVFSVPAVARPKGGGLATWVEAVKTRILDWVRMRGTAAAQPAAAVRSRDDSLLRRLQIGTAPAQPAPRQGELLLEGIKVVRNDLSESDLEIVKANAAPAATGAPEVNPARKPVARPGAWDRVRSRLVGAGKNQE